MKTYPVLVGNDSKIDVEHVKKMGREKMKKIEQDKKERDIDNNASNEEL